jgi:hypothetical protein
MKKKRLFQKVIVYICLSCVFALGLMTILGSTVSMG